MNSCCTLYHINPSDLENNLVQLKVEESDCSTCGCQCGYIQFESLAPYMTKLLRHSTQDDDHIILEARLRQQIVEISRLFDSETRVEPGFYSKAHYKLIKLYGNGSSYLKIPDFVPGTLELYTENGYLINPKSYIYKDGMLITNPCSSHSPTCGCTLSCGIYQPTKIPAGWNGCLQAKAKFGKSCADIAVQLAVRDYLIEHNTFGDIQEVMYKGLPIVRSFKVPHSWAVLTQTYREEKKLFNQFGFA